MDRGGVGVRIAVGGMDKGRGIKRIFWNGGVGTKGGTGLEMEGTVLFTKYENMIKQQNRSNKLNE